MATTHAPNPIQEVVLTDFTGGLNYRADAFQLADHESPDMLNVDLDPRGGFSQRDGVAVLNATAISTPGNMWQFSTTTGTAQVLVQQGNDFSYSTGSDFTSVNPDALTMTGRMRAVTFKDLNWIQRNAEQVAIKWTGSAATALGTTFNDDLTTPTGANMPKAKCITAHKGYVWVANTVESGTAFASRVRWSHPNQPADFRTNDYIDVDVGNDGDQITALCSFGDRLLIFKANSVHVLTGYDPATFAVFPVTYTAGAVSQEAVTVCELGVYFFSWPNGLMKYDGSSVQWNFERLHPAIDDGRIPAAAQAGITVAWINRRVWVSVPWQGSSSNARVFVLDPSLYRRKRYGSLLGREGGWTAYDLPLATMMAWHPPGGVVQWLAAHVAAGHVMKLHQAGSTTDTRTTAGGAVNIVSYYTTRWFDAGNPSIIKRWKRPELVLKGGATGTVRVDVRHNFDASQIKRTMHISTVAPSNTAMVWDTDTWDTKLWGGDSANTEVIDRMSVLGRSRATQLTFTGPAPSIDWQIDAIFLKYIPRRLRG